MRKRITINIKKGFSRIKVRTWVGITLILLMGSIAAVRFLNPFAGEAAWYDTSYLYRIPLTVNNSASASTLTNFPVLVKLTSANFDFNLTQSDGDDIRFTDSDGVTLIDYDLEKWDATNKVAHIWIEVPSLTATATYRIYMYYGNASASSAANSDNTWNSNYALVQHLDETSGTHVDSTSNNNDSTSITITNQGADIGKIDGADNFDGTDDVVQIDDSNSLDVTNTGTIEAWIKPDIVTLTQGTLANYAALTAPDGSASASNDGIDITVVGENVYYAAYLNSGAADSFQTANSTLAGASFSGWTDQTDPGGAGVGDNTIPAIDSDGNKLYYAALSTGAGTEAFFTANSDLDGTNFSLWTDQTDPTGCGNDVSCDMEMVITAGKMYFAVLMNTGSVVSLQVANSDLDGTNFSGWTTLSAPPTDGGGGGFVGLGLATNGDRLYYVSSFTSTVTTGRTIVAISNSALAGSGQTAWREITGPARGQTNVGSDIDAEIVGSKIFMYYAGTANSTQSTGNTDLDGSNFTGWTEKGGGCGGGGGENQMDSLASDGKTMVFVCYAHSNEVETLLFSSASLTNRPIISKLAAYELIQSGAGFVFDWAGSAKSFKGINNTTDLIHVAVTHDGTTMKYFLNGSTVRTQTVTTDFGTNTNNFRIGAQVSFFDGVIDEVRVSSTGQSDDWIEATYLSGNNQMVSFGVSQEYKEPVGFWKLDDGAGTTVNDTSKNTNSLTLSGATWQNEDLCVDGKCLFFDGVDDNLTRADDSDFDFTASESFTLQAWFRHEPVTSGTDMIIAKYDSGTGTDGGYKMYMESDGDITCGIDDDQTSFPEDSTSSTAATYDDNNWHLATCVKSAITSLTLYIDGYQVGTPDTTISATGTLVNTDALYIGIDSEDGTSNPWEGFLDEIKIYPYARSTAQINSDFLKGASDIGSGVVFGTQDTEFLNDGLVGYWKLDEASGNASDSSGNATTLTNVSTTAYTGAKFGNGMEPDGTADYLSAADNSALSVTGSLTLAAWIQPDDTTGSQDIIAKWDGSNESYLLAMEGADLRMYIDSSSSYQATTATPLVANTLQHVAGVYDATTQTVTLYVNGEIATSSTTGTIPSSIGDDAGVFHLGAEDSTTAAANFFDGHIDEARVYNRPLSNGEIKALYNWAAGPLLHTKFDEGTGTSTYDTAGNLTGTLTNMDSATDWVPGKYGQALDFDGSDDYVNFSDDDDIDFSATQDFTISFWFYRPTDLVAGETFIANNDDDTDDQGWVINNSSSRMRLSIDDGPDTFSQQTVAIFNDANGNLNKWIHVSFVIDRDSASNTKVYVNGVDNTGTQTGTITDIGDLDNVRGLRIAARSTATPANFIDGRIDDLRIYNYVRTHSQVIEDINAGHPIGGSPLGTQTLYWKFDEGYGTDAFNSAYPTGTDGTITGATYISASCKINNCLSFDAAGERVALAAASDSAVDFATTEKFSGSAWVYVTTMPGSGEQDAIIAKWDDTNNQAAYKIYVENDDADSTGNFEVQIYDESASQAITASQSNDSVSQNTWYHVAFTFNGGTAGTTGDLKLYVNGKFTAQNAANASFAGLENLGSDFTVGEYDTNDVVATNTAFTGYVDEVKIYANELTSDQIVIDMNAGGGINVSVGQREAALLSDGAGNAPVLYWKLDENRSTTINDSSGNGNTATGTGIDITNWEPGKYGSAVHFDGSGESFSTSSTFDPPAEGTVSFWIYSDDTPSAVERPFGNADDWEGRLTTGSIINFDLGFSGAGSTCISTSTITPGAWYYVAGVYSSANDTCKVYLNGVLEASVSQTTADPAAATTHLGKSSSGNSFDGKLDEFKVFDYELTAAQIAYDYNRGKAIAYWKFDECSGTTANDSGSNTYTGTIEPGSLDNTAVGTCSSGTTTHMWNDGTTGKRNASIGLDGDDDYVQISDTANLRFDTATQDFSLFAWVKRNANGEMNIISKEDADNDGWRLQFTSGNAVRCSVDAVDVDSTSTITDTNWHHVGCTIDRDGNGQVYIDGKTDGSATAISSEAMATTSNIRIGTRSYTSTNFLDGQVDDLRIYLYTLSASQVRQVMNDAAVRFGPATGSP